MNQTSSYSIYTQEPTPPAPKKSKFDLSPTQKKRVGIIGGAVLLVVGAGAAVWATRGPSITSADAAPEQVAAFIATDTFANMSAEQQQPYLDRFEQMGWDNARNASQGLDRETRGDAMRNLMEARQNKEMAEFFALPIGPERDAFLDKQIDEMTKRMQEMAANGRGRGGPGGGGAPRGGEARPADNRGNRPPGGATRESRRKARYENSNSTRAAQRQAYRQAMRDRMEKRGVTLPNRGGRR